MGTNVGIALTIPLPRLEGVPIISGKANISYHAFRPGLRKRTHLTDGDATFGETAASEQEYRLLQGHIAHQVQLKPEYE